jgi:PPOX class probable F420-dependent enzyme
VRLDDETCWARLRSRSHGVLGTVHASRGLDLVPVVFAVLGDDIVVPIDTVKPKSTTKLQRLANIEHDARCSMLVDHYDDDWAQLWWVRVHARATVIDPSDAQRAALAARFSQYTAASSVASAIVLHVESINGWSAA